MIKGFWLFSGDRKKFSSFAPSMPRLHRLDQARFGGILIIEEQFMRTK